jgi:hypothetical protein
MPRSGALLLSDYPSEWVNVACTKCTRAGRLRKDSLISQHGDIPLPDLLPAIAVGCPRVGNMYDACGAYYVELKPS